MKKNEHMRHLFNTRTVEFFIQNGRSREYYTSTPETEMKGDNTDWINISSMYKSYTGDQVYNGPTLGWERPVIFTYMNEKGINKRTNFLCKDILFNIPWKDIHIVCSYSKQQKEAA